MAQKTDSQLIIEANIIRDETVPGQNTAVRVGTMLDDVIDSKINNDRIDNNTALGTSSTLVPSQIAVKTYVDGIVTGLLDDRGGFAADGIGSPYPSSNGSGQSGAILKGDIWFVSVAGTIGTTSVSVGDSVRALEDAPGQDSAKWDILATSIGFVPEDVTNKSNDVTLGGGSPSSTLYPTQNAVKTYVDGTFQTTIGWTTENEANKVTDEAGFIANAGSSVKYPSVVAVKDYIDGAIPSPQDLQSVLNAGHTLTSGLNYQGTNAGGTNPVSNVNAFGDSAADANSKDNVNAFGQNAAVGNSGDHLNAMGYNSANSNTGDELNAFGYEAGFGNTGDNVNGLGYYAAKNNTGNHVNALGNGAAQNNTGSNVTAIGYAAGASNTYSNVALLGYAAAADADNQIAFKASGINARISSDTLTTDRKYELPDKNGTFAMLSDISGSNIQSVKVSLNSTQLLSLTPFSSVSLISAQGAGTLIRPIAFTFHYNYGTTPYFGSSLILSFSTGGGQITSSTLLTNNTSNVISFPPLSTSAIYTDAAINDSLVIKSGGSLTNGDGTLDVYITYQVITL